jgi:hypothetical protein
MLFFAIATILPIILQTDATSRQNNRIGVQKTIKISLHFSRTVPELNGTNDQ